MGLMAHSLPQTLKLGPIQIISQDRLVIWVSALLDNNARTLPGRQSSHVRQTLFGNDDIEIVLRLVNVRAERNDAADTGGINLAGPCGRGVHDAVLGVAKEIGRAAEAVKHTRAHDAGAVGVGVDVDFDGGVHADDAEAADDLGGVGDLLRAQEELAGVTLPVVVEALETVGREADRGGGCEVKVATVEEVQEGVLQDFGPDLQVGEVGTALAETTDDGVGDVANAGLNGEQVLGQTTVLDLVLEELDQVGGDGLGALVLGGVGLGLVGVIGFDDGDDLLGVDGDIGSSNTVFGGHNQVGLTTGREIGAHDIVQAFERGTGRVHLDNDLVGHLDQLRRSAHRGTRNDTTILCNRRCLDNGDVNLVLRLVQSIVALNRSIKENG